MRSTEWHTGDVDTIADHVEIRYGSIDHSGWDEWRPVALVQPCGARTFVVHFLLDETVDTDARIAQDLRKEIDFYLVELGERDPWVYIKYHCGTAANIYSPYHWSFNAR